MRASGWTKGARAGLLALAAWVTAAEPGRAQDSGAPLRILVGFPAGGTIDVVARLLADQLRADLGQPVNVESRPGAGGLLAAQAVTAAAPDGRTLLLSPDHTMVMLPLTIEDRGFPAGRPRSGGAGGALCGRIRGGREDGR